MSSSPEAGMFVPNLQQRALPTQEISKRENVVVDLPPVLYFEDHSLPRPEKPSSAYPTFHRAANVPVNELGFKRYRVGEWGPVNASTTNQENNENKELKRYETVFGRDSLRTAIDLQRLFPNLLPQTLIRHAQLQATSDNIRSEAQIGGVIHEYRSEDDQRGQELAHDNGWEFPYYGTVDATILFAQGIALEAQHNPDFLDTIAVHKKTLESYTLLESHDAAINWMKRRANQNKQGFIEFQSSFQGSLEVQSWKDSWDSHHHKNGMLANHNNGVASIEVQAMAYDTFLSSAEMYELLGRNEDAADLQERAEKIHRNMFEYMWTENERGGFFSLGTDRDADNNPRPLSIKTSNMGHVLNSRIFENMPKADRDYYIQSIIHRLFSPEMLSAGGIKTLASDEKRFHPEAYHNGSVWPWDSQYIASGLERQGYYGLAWDLHKRFMNIVVTHNIFPENVSGGENSEPQLNTRIVKACDLETGRINNIADTAQIIQTWTVKDALLIKHKLGDILLNHENAVPIHAVDMSKRQFEDEIIANIPQPTGKFYDIIQQQETHPQDLEAADD